MTFISLFIAGAITINAVGTFTVTVTVQSESADPLLQGGRFGFTLPNFTGAGGAMTPAQFVTTFSGAMHSPGKYLDWIAAGTDIRLLNPSGMYMKHINFRTLFDEDLSHPDDDYVHANHPEWMLRMANGDPVPIFVAGEESMDFGNDQYLDWALNTWMPNDYLDSTDDDLGRLTFYLHDNGNFLAQGGLDCTHPICAPYKTDAGVQAAWINLCNRFREAWPYKRLLISGGANTFQSPATQMVNQTNVLAHADGLYTENLVDRHSFFSASAGSAKRNYLQTNLLLADYLAVNDKYFFATMSPDNGVTINQDDVNYAYAFFNLLRSGNKQFYCHTTKDGSDLWQPAAYPEMDLPLGNPLEARTEISTNVYRRDFEQAIAYVNLSDSTANITLPAGTYENSLGASVGSPLSLPSFSGLTIYKQ